MVHIILFGDNIFDGASHASKINVVLNPEDWVSRIIPRRGICEQNKLCPQSRGFRISHYPRRGLCEILHRRIERSEIEYLALSPKGIMRDTPSEDWAKRNWVSRIIPEGDYARYSIGGSILKCGTMEMQNLTRYRSFIEFNFSITIVSSLLLCVVK
jgi:hypothetical protein